MTPAPTYQRADIQGLRGIAVLLVVLFHAGLGTHGGFVGVDVFFVLSGYVIMLNLLRELQKTQSLALIPFYTRRFRRLLPAAAVMSAFTLGASVIFLSPEGSQQVAAYTAVAASSFVANLYLMGWGHDYFAASAELNPFLHTWSLSVEEQFYAVFPGIAWLVWRFGKGRNPMTAFQRIVAGLCVVSFLLSVWCAWTTTEWVVSPSRVGFYVPLTRAWEFAFGTLLAMIPQRALSPRVAAVVATTGMAMVLGSAVLLHESPRFPGAIAMIPVLGTVLLLWSVPSSPRWEHLLSRRWLTWLGDLSYSWYLWHWPFIVMLPLAFPDAGQWLLALAAAAALLPAWLSWKWVEVPVRSNTRLSGLRLLPWLAVWILGPIALAAALRVGASWGWGIDRSDGWALQPVAYEAPCGDGVWGDNEDEQCRLGRSDTNGHVLLIGDSHASSLSEGLHAALEDREMGVWVAWKAACPFLHSRWNAAVPGCREFQERMWDVIAQHPPVAVVIAHRHSRYLRILDSGVSVNFVMTDASGGRVQSDSESLESYTQGLQETVAELQRLGIPVVVVAPVPEFPPFTNRVSLWNQGVMSAPELPASSLQTQRAEVNPVLNALPTDTPGIVLMDPAPAFCDAQRCLPTVGAAWAYLDYNHLNPIGSRHLESIWRTTFNTLLGSTAAP
jgi:peptidoglycan/LPS O-acetylase OafA/YrhL